MEYLDMDLHGIPELIDVRGRKILSRYPDAVNKAIGHTTAYQLNGTEIRLVPLEDCYVSLESLGRRHATKVMVYYGDMPYPEEFHFEKEVTIPVLIGNMTSSSSAKNSRILMPFLSRSSGSSFSPKTY